METRKRKVAFHTLGCKLNFAETSAISRLFPEDQYERVPANTRADIYIINTCSVTDSAERKCRQAVRKFIGMAPDAYIAVVGCYTQMRPQELSAIPGVDLVLGTNERFSLTDYLSDTTGRFQTRVHSGELSDNDVFHPSFSIGDRTRSFLKVQDGCDYGCSYCTVPLARGRSRNPEIKSLVSDARKIAASGVKEIVVTGVNTGDFGKSTGESFTSLLSELTGTAGIERLRISSVEPNLLTDELIDLTASNEKIMPHFHIPLQSGSDRVLGLMGRRYRSADFAGRVERIRKLMPFAGIGADIIVGFPGETAPYFEETYLFLRDLPLSYLHVFSFSARPGTRAEKLPGRVSDSEKTRRSRVLISLSKTKQLEFNRMNLGRTTEVLFEQVRSDGMISGFTPNYIRAWHPWKSALAGSIKQVRLKEITATGKVNVEII
ncbi:MAG: tRNA (N(6)-L-threonylcarbamoyladenosine(37)-C(2))-methylthiotransferase MtaB [Bacteroidales bacterium]